MGRETGKFTWLKEKIVVGWSGGKDSAFALYEILKSGGYEVVELLTTLAQDFDRISIHGVRRVLLEQPHIAAY